MRWNPHGDAEKQKVSITLGGLGDAYRLGGFPGAFSYAINCLAAWNLTQTVAVKEAEAADFIAENLSILDSKQFGKLLETPNDQEIPVIGLVVKAGSADAQKNVLQFFQRADRHEHLNSQVHILHDNTSGAITLAQLMVDIVAQRLGENDTNLKQFNSYCEQNKIQLAIEQTAAGARTVADGRSTEPLLEPGISAAISQTYTQRTFPSIIPEAKAANMRSSETKLSLSDEIELFLKQKCLTDDLITCDRIRKLPNELARLATFLKTDHTCHEIREEIESIFGYGRELTQALEALSISGLREPLIKVLRGTNGKSLPNLLPLDSSLRRDFAEPLCREFGISFNETKFEFRHPGFGLFVQDGTRRYGEMNKLLDSNTPEGIYAVVNQLIISPKSYAWHYAKQFPESCKMLEEILNRVHPLLERIKPFVSPSTWDSYAKDLEASGVKINELVHREPIPPMPLGQCPLASSQEFPSYMQAIIAHMEGLIRWNQLKEARNLFQRLHLGGNVLLHLSDADVLRLRGLPKMRSPDGISMNNSLQTMDDQVTANEAAIKNRLAMTAEKIDAALDKVTPQNAYGELSQKRPWGLTLTDTILSVGTKDHKAKLLQILRKLPADAFVKILSFGKNNIDIASFLMSDNADSEILQEKLASMPSEEFIASLNSGSIFKFLCKSEDGCTLLERQFSDPGAFIKLIHKSWFGPEELSFFYSIRGNQEIGDVDASGNQITITEWNGGVSDPHFLLKMANDPGVFCAVMQRSNLWFPFIRLTAACAATRPEDILSPERFINLMQTPNATQIFDSMRIAAITDRASKQRVRNFFVGLLETPKVVRELSKIPWIGSKLMAAISEFNLPPNSKSVIYEICSDALSNPGQPDEAVWRKIFETKENRSVLWEICNDLAQQHGVRAQAFFSRLTKSETFRQMTIGHEAGHHYQESGGIPEILTEIGQTLNSQAKRYLLLGQMPPETTYGEANTQYIGGATSHPYLLANEPNGPRYANFAQEMLRKHSNQLFAFLDGMTSGDMAAVLSKRADNGCTPLEFAVLNRRDSTVSSLANYYRKRKVPFSRIGLREMLIFKEKTFAATTENLLNGGVAVPLASMGGAAVAELTRNEFNDIVREFPREQSDDRANRIHGALNKAAKQKKDAMQTAQNELLESITSYVAVIAKEKADKKDTAQYQEALDTLIGMSTIGVSGRIALAVAAERNESGAQALFDQYLDIFIGESPGVTPLVGILDDAVLNATEIEITERDDNGWIAMVGGAKVRVENIADLAQCQKLEAITFNFLWGNKITADELFALRNVKALKRLELGRFSASFTPNLAEILFRARPDLSISAICPDEKKLIWDPRFGPNYGQMYSCHAAGHTRM